MSSEERNRAITRTTKDEEKIVKLLPVLGGAKAVLHDIELFWHGRPDYIGANTGTLAHFIKEAEAVL